MVNQHAHEGGTCALVVAVRDIVQSVIDNWKGSDIMRIMLSRRVSFEMV